MILSIISYALHLLIIIPFFLLMPFSIFLRGHELENNQKGLVKLLKIYKVVLLVAHVALVVAILTGLYLRFEFSLWVTSVIVIWVAIGAFLGLTAKYVRLLLENLDERKDTKDAMEKAKRFSKLLTLAIATMFVLKYATLYM